MILYFADRQLNILGQASTSLPQGLTVLKDNLVDDVDTGVGTFECYIPYDSETRAQAEQFTALGNYLLYSDGDESRLFTIIDTEQDTEENEILLYAEDEGMDLLNEVVGSYEADKAYNIAFYINKYAAAAGFEIGINEAASLTRKLSWDGEATAAERIASVATQFDGCEVSYSFKVDGLTVSKKLINIYKQRGTDTGVQLRLNNEISGIIVEKTINNIATALYCKGGTPEDENTEDDKTPDPITLKGYKYDDGDFYVDGELLKSRKALENWSRYLWKTDTESVAGGHIVKQYSYDTLQQSTLCAHAVTELKKLREMEVNYKVTIAELPANVRVGDRVNIIDDAGELYVSSRILILEKSVADNKTKATLGEYLIKTNGISDKVAALAEKFAKNTVSTQRALAIANSAKTLAAEAQAEVDEAVKSVEEAQKAIEDVADVVETARQSAEAAQQAADNAQQVVDGVQSQINGLETTIANANTAAQQAQQAAATAETKATEAQQAAVKAASDAATAATAAGNAQSAAESAGTKADTAKTTAEQAKADAAAAATTAAAAKLDAENAQKGIDELGDSLTTLSNTMSADYARKTELTETEASLQSQITQNAAQISSTVTQMQSINETANNAAEQAETAQNSAAQAQAEAEQAKADAAEAQTAADNAATAASNAQSEADKAKAAAAAAQSVADKAEADLEAAQADLETVQGRVDATEADILAAQNAVNTAQAAANEAKANAATAAEKAATAQNTANTAVDNAAAAQTKANEAADAAAIAQQTADAAKGDAAAAQTKANEAASAAATAKSTADTAKANAEAAQTKANQAASAAAAAQKAADDADAKAAQAQTNLATAQANLAEVTSRVDATEEEVAAAQAAVQTAQAAAQAAQADAEAAQATANTAKTNAANAQTAANEAKTAADNAQTAADDAQEAADKAQADVDALAVRVESAETSITQNAENIELRASKEEVTETLGGYYSKEETEALVNVSADEIKLSVAALENTAAENKAQIEASESEISILKDKVVTMVKDENGNTTLTQEGDGWSFDMSAAGNKLAHMHIKEEYDEEAEKVRPVIELGAENDPDKVKITNGEIDFIVENNVKTTIDADGLNTDNIIVKNEIRQGGFVWVKHGGNVGLIWKGV